MLVVTVLAITLLHFLSSLTVFIFGIAHSSAGSSVEAGLFCSIYVFASYLVQQGASCYDVSVLYVSLIELGGAVCSIVLAVRSFHMKFYYDNQLNYFQHLNMYGTIMTEEDKKTIEKFSNYHLCLATASVINFILTVIWVSLLTRHSFIKNDNQGEGGSESNSNNDEQNVNSHNERNMHVEVRLNGQVQAPSNYVVNGSSVASTYNLAGGEINHAEPSAPPISGDPLPSFEDLEPPPPRYEDIYKTTTE